MHFQRTLWGRRVLSSRMISRISGFISLMAVLTLKAVSLLQPMLRVLRMRFSWSLSESPIVLIIILLEGEAVTSTFLSLILVSFMKYACFNVLSGIPVAWLTFWPKFVRGVCGSSLEPLGSPVQSSRPPWKSPRSSGSCLHGWEVWTCSPGICGSSCNIEPATREHSDSYGSRFTPPENLEGPGVHLKPEASTTTR